MRPHRGLRGQKARPAAAEGGPRRAGLARKGLLLLSCLELDVVFTCGLSFNCLSGLVGGGLGSVESQVGEQHSSEENSMGRH